MLEAAADRVPRFHIPGVLAQPEGKQNLAFIAGMQRLQEGLPR